jgi:hypothetical protein
MTRPTPKEAKENKFILLNIVKPQVLGLRF